MMQPHTRTLKEPIFDDLPLKMVFVGGPRQVGKTTLSKMLGAAFRAPAYFNWDNRMHRMDDLLVGPLQLPGGKPVSNQRIHEDVEVVLNGGSPDGRLA